MERQRDIRHHDHGRNSTRERADRRGHHPLRCVRFRRILPLLVLTLLAWGAGPVAPLLAQTDAVPAPARVLMLSDIQLEGATRTPLATVYRYLPLRPGQPIDQQSLVDGVAALREGGVFRSVDFYTRPGAQRGQLVLVLEVVEHDLDFRWAAGNTNLDGWYLSPAMLTYDNPFGRGGRSDIQWRVGFRTTGLLMSYAQPRTADGRRYWGTRLSLMGTERPWFADGVEYFRGIDAITRGGAAVDDDAQRGQAGDGVGVHVGGAVDAAQHLLDAFADGLQHGEIGAVQVDRHVAAHAADQLVGAQLDGLRERVVLAGHLVGKRGFDGIDQRCLVGCLLPSLDGMQHQIDV